MAVRIRNATTQDTFVDALMLRAPFTVEIQLQIANAAVDYELDLDPSGHGQWQAEPDFLAPSVGILSRRCGGIRFRSALAGSPAQLSCQLLNEGDLAGGSSFLSGFTEHVSAAGGIGPGVGQELAYVERTATVVIAATAEATPTDIIDLGIVSFDGATTIQIEVYCPQLFTKSDAIGVSLWEMQGPTNLGRLALPDATGLASSTALPLYARSEKFTPGAGNRQYRIRAYRNAGVDLNPEWRAGAGGAGALTKSWAKVVVA